jgi:long-chain acyl-CoA synthetase
VPKGSTGELYTKSPYLFSGYWQRPEETSQAVRDGWVSAGDLARQDEEGFYYIVDRKKDMVVSGGINVYPREIEETLYQHPAVQEAAVIGVPDDHWGEAPIAYIVLRAGMSVDPGELAAHCRKTLAGYKIPKAFRIIASLPRSASGKVLKTELRTRI